MRVEIKKHFANHNTSDQGVWNHLQLPPPTPHRFLPFITDRFFPRFLHRLCVFCLQWTFNPITYLFLLQWRYVAEVKFPYTDKELATLTDPDYYIRYERFKKKGFQSSSLLRKTPAARWMRAWWPPNFSPGLIFPTTETVSFLFFLLSLFYQWLVVERLTLFCKWFHKYRKDFFLISIIHGDENNRFYFPCK